MRAVVNLPAYRRLLAAYMLNELAWGIGSLALAVLVYRRTGSAIGATAYFLCAQFVPALISPALVGRLDRLTPRSVLPALYALEALAFLALGWLASRFALAPVLALTIADGVVALSARAISRAATVRVTSPPGLLREGNALANGAFSVCFMAGPALGGVAVAAGGTAAALFINSGLFAASALVLATAAGLPGAAAAEHGPRARVRAALAHAWARPAIRALLGLQALAMLFFTISVPVEVVLVQHSLHAGAGGYGAVLAAWGAGAIIGSAVYARWRGLPARALIALGAVALGAGFIVMASAPSIALASAGSALAGAGNGVWVVAARTSLQEQVEAEWMALMMSLSESIFQAVPGLGIALGGALAALAGARAALGVAGAGTLLLIPVGWVLLRPQRPAAGSSAPSDPPTDDAGSGALHQPAATR